jgi:hypothetical protein
MASAHAALTGTTEPSSALAAELGFPPGEDAAGLQAAMKNTRSAAGIEIRGTTLGIGWTSGLFRLDEWRIPRR